MSVEIEMGRFAALIHAMRSRYQSGVYSRAIIFSTRRRARLHRQVHVVAEGRHTVDRLDNVARKVARMAGGEAHAPDPGTSPTAVSNSAKLRFPSGSR